MKNLLTILSVVFFIPLFSQNVGINNTGSPADNSAMLDVSANDKGVLIPRLTAAQRTGISAPAEGLLVYQSDGVSGFYYYDGSDWVTFLDDKKGWSLDGNAGTDPLTDYVGTSDAVDLTLRTSDVDRFSIHADGRVGLNGGFFTPLSAINVAAFSSGANTAIGASSDGSGAAIYGQTIGNGFGIEGLSNSINGLPVWAQNINTSGTGLLAIGNNSFPFIFGAGSGAAINGNPVGTLSYGNNVTEGWGILAAGNDLAVSFLAQGGGGAFTGSNFGTFSSANASSGNRSAFVGNYNFSGGNTVYVGAVIGGTHYKVFGSGGGSVSTSMETREGERILFAPESPENWFFDIGEVQLENGIAEVAIDPIFVDCISSAEPFKVIVQAGENTLGAVRVTRNQEEFSFLLEDLGGQSSGTVIYKIYGIWKGKENLRFPEYINPTTVIKSEKIPHKTPRTSSAPKQVEKP